MITYTARFRSAEKALNSQLLREFGGSEGKSFDFVYSEKTIERAKSDQDAVRVAQEFARNENKVLLSVIKTIALYQA